MSGVFVDATAVHRLVTETVPGATEGGTPLTRFAAEDVVTVRSGRRFATATATLTMDSRPILSLLGTFGEQTPGGPALTREAPVDLPD